MAKIFFAPVPVAGHFFPTIPVAHALKKRGHEVVYLSDLNMKEIIEGEGFPYYPIGPGVWAGNLLEKYPKIGKLKGNPRIHYILMEVYLGLAPDYVRDVIPVVEREKPDLFVFDSLSFPGPVAAELTGTKWVTTSMFLGMIPSGEMPPFSLGWPPPRSGLQKFLYWFIWQGFIFYCHRYDREVNRIRRMFGLKRKKQAFLWSALSPYLYLTFTTFDIEYPREHYYPQIHLVGPSLWSRPRNYQPPDWLVDYPERRPAVYITIGTVESVYERKFFPMVIDVFRELPDVQGVMTVCYPGRDVNGMGIPPNLRVEQYVPNAEIIPKSDLVIHHGGFSTTMDCMVNGIPAIGIPMEGDQNENGRRIRESGAGYYLQYKGLTAKKLKDAILRALGDESIKRRAREISGKLKKYNGPETASDLIEKVLETGKPVYRPDASISSPTSPD